MAGPEGVKVTLLSASLGPRREQTGRADWLQREEKEPKPMVLEKPVGEVVKVPFNALRGAFGRRTRRDEQRSVYCWFSRVDAVVRMEE